MTGNIRRIAAVLTAAMLVGGVALAFGLGPALADSPDDTPGNRQGKVIVCKYVGEPRVSELLQTGQNPIAVSVNAINAYQDNDHSGTVSGGDTFAEGQNGSMWFVTLRARLTTAPSQIWRTAQFRHQRRRLRRLRRQHRRRPRLRRRFRIRPATPASRLGRGMGDPLINNSLRDPGPASSAAASFAALASEW
jgi:hypothetical protein